MRLLRLLYWPPFALARWVNVEPDRTATDRAFYSAIYSVGWTVVLLGVISLVLDWLL